VYLVQYRLEWLLLTFDSFYLLVVMHCCVLIKIWCPWTNLVRVKLTRVDILRFLLLNKMNPNKGA